MAPALSRRLPRVALVTFGPIAPAMGGLAVRCRAVVEDLVALGCEVRVASVGEEGRKCLSICGQSVEIDAVSTPSLWQAWALLLRWLKRVANGVDCIVVESALLLPPVMGARLRVPVIWDTNELETLHYRRLPRTWPNVWRLWVWRSLETWACRRASVVVAIGAEEARWWQRFFPQCADRLMVVDHRPLRAEGDKDERGAPPFPDDIADVLFVGNMSAKHNWRAACWIVDDLAPRLPPGVRVALVGPGSERVLSRPAGKRGGASPTPSTVAYGGSLTFPPSSVGRPSAWLLSMLGRE